MDPEALVQLEREARECARANLWADKPVAATQPDPDGETTSPAAAAALATESTSVRTPRKGASSKPTALDVSAVGESEYPVVVELSSAPSSPVSPAESHAAASTDGHTVASTDDHAVTSAEDGSGKDVPAAQGNGVATSAYSGLKRASKRKQPVESQTEHSAGTTRQNAAAGASTSAYGTLTRASKRTRPVVKSENSDDDDDLIIWANGQLRLPKWYNKVSRHELNAAARNFRSTIDKMNEAKRLIGAITNLLIQQEDTLFVPKSDDDIFKQLKRKLNDLRGKLHDLERLDVTPAIIRKAAFFNANNGLIRVFTHDPKPSEYNFPGDLKSDAEELFNKWAAGRFKAGLLEGIEPPKRARKGGIEPAKGAQKGDGWHLTKNYPYKVSGAYYGHGKLKNGTWFWCWLAMNRDGAHNSSQAGIATGPDGAYSVVMSHNAYPNVDEGENVWYYGTDQDPKKTGPTENTAKLILNKASGHPVRLMRSDTLPASNPYKPIAGVRYDGLYEVKHYELVDTLKQRYVFHLKRLPGQDQIRYDNDETGRPTAQELRDFRILQANKTWKDE